ncbi:MAG TPA: hypothetical protein VNJ08_14565 [Bacteriovoracaceae bacterium]|nr:hypothetical protein [Bacteriovoracaceae bacterium]
MEGPSIVIATEELKPFEKQKILSSNRENFIGMRYIGSRSWGKHLLLTFSKINLRIHFLMFGSYRIDNPRENRIPKLELRFKQGIVYFYSCAIKEIPDGFEEDYDWTIDTMSEEFSKPRAKKVMLSKPKSKVCDLLMDQTIFAGVGNIIKNEVLYLQKLHPDTRIEILTPKEISDLIKVTIKYCHQFYEWKKMNVLKRNWKIFRKKKCPVCLGPIIKRPTGKLQRISHFCLKCQPLNYV